MRTSTLKIASIALAVLSVATYAWLKSRPQGMDSEIETVGAAFVKGDADTLNKYLSPEEIACGVDREVLEHALELLVKPVSDQFEISHIQIQSTLDNVTGTAFIVFMEGEDRVAQTDFEISVVPDAGGNPKAIVPVLATALNLAIGLRHYHMQRGHLQGGAQLSTAEVLSQYIESYKNRFPGRPLPGVYTYSQNSFYSDPTHQGGGTCTPIEELRDEMLSRVPPELRDQYEAM